MLKTTEQGARATEAIVKGREQNDFDVLGLS